MYPKKILYCFAGSSVFGYRDIEMLKNAYHVSIAHFDLKLTFMGKAWSYLKYNFDIVKKIFFVDIVIVNFGSWHTIFPVFFAKVFRKQSIIILGGFDAGNIPSLQYGVFHKPSMLQGLMRKTYQAATYLCPVSEALVASINTYADPSGEGYKIGLLHHMPEVKDKIRVIPTDYDNEFWYNDESKDRKGILALAYVYNTETYNLKGFDLINQCAVEMPEYSFTFAGFSPEMVVYYQSKLPSNVKLISFVNNQEARALYQRHKIFILPSLTEGLPNTLCESMLCGCIPVVSDVSVMPKIVNELGYILKRRNKQELKILLEKATQNNSNNLDIRNKIITQYPMGQRLSNFKMLIEK
jgi:glycosyltransferase involved in cell wall biosynthesis